MAVPLILGLGGLVGGSPGIGMEAEVMLNVESIGVH